ncbi:6571_t:CDS:2 [Entrophospora sp. SA101]|nr:6571_t:CDS:2 [Entrophospora sp. SA101]
MLRTWIRWSRDDLTLNMTHKLPFYIASSGNNNDLCFSNDTSKYIHIALLSVDMTILLISIYCYIGITYTINISRLQVDEQFLIALRKIVGYLFMFITQWTPVMIYVLIDIKTRAPMWTFFVFFISLPLGGVLNCYRYISNEGWWVNPRGAATSSITSTYSSPNTPTSPSSPSSKTINRQQIVGDKHQDSYLVRMPEENEHLQCACHELKAD